VAYFGEEAEMKNGMSFRIVVNMMSTFGAVASYCLSLIVTAFVETVLPMDIAVLAWALVFPFFPLSFPTWLSI
jgi:hypothetical protein